MSRSSTITDDQILGAAREVFVEEGFAATTARIAGRAGISEGSIFRRFASKEELFHESMRIERPAWFDAAPELSGALDARHALEGLATRLIEFMVEITPVLFLTLSCGPRAERRLGPTAPSTQCLEVITVFFENHVPGAKQPDSLARLFVGACFHFAFCEVSGVNEMRPVARAEFVEDLVNCVLGGAP